MITLTYPLDMRPIGVPPVVRISQYDDDFQLIFLLKNFDGVFSLTSGTTAEIHGTKSDGHGYSADCAIDTANKTVTVTGDIQMTASKGENVYEIVLFKSGKRLASSNFILFVEPAALDAETTASDSKIKDFTAMVDAATEAAETATEAATTATEAASTFSTDTGLTISGKAADAQAVGQRMLTLHTSNRTSITSGNDLDTYTTPGNFKITTQANANGVANLPSKVPGSLFVMHGSDSNRQYQIYFAQASTNLKIFVREKIGAAGAWTDWLELTYRYTVDTAPTEDSGNLITSGGVYTAIESAIAALNVEEGAVWD